MKRLVSTPILFFLLIVFLFFNPIFKGMIPFPGDVLVGNSFPYNTNSYGIFSPGFVPHKAQGIDVVRQLFPWKDFAVQSLKNGKIPLWNPYNLSGNPLMANFQSGLFYPLNVLFFLSSFTNGWTVYVLLIPLLSAIFTYIFMREIGVSKVAASYAGIVFAFSSYMVVWMEWGNIGHSLLWMPLALFFTEKLLKTFTRKYAWLLILTLVLSLLAGYIQGYFYLTAVIVVYFLAKHSIKSPHGLKKTIVFFLLLVAPALLTLFQLLPTIELFSLSSRSNYSLSQIQSLLNPIWYSITTIVPNFFGNPAARNHWFFGTYIERVSYFGLIPFLLACFAIFNRRSKKEISIFAVLSFSSLFFATDFFINRYLYLLPMPFISTTVPTRILSIFVFSGSVLSGIGLDILLSQQNKKRLLSLLIGFFTFFLILWCIVFLLPKVIGGSEVLSHFAVAKRNLLLPTLFFVVFAIAAVIFIAIKQQKKFVANIFVLLIIIFTFTDLFLFFSKITPFSPTSYVYPRTPVISFLKNKGIWRSWGYGTAYIDTNFQTFEHTFSSDGYEPLHINRYNEFISSSKNGKIPTIVPRADANIIGGYGQDDLRNNFYRQRIINLLGVKYIIHNFDTQRSSIPDTATFPEERYQLVWNRNGQQVYENKDVLPRFFLASKNVVEKDEQKIISTLLNKEFDYYTTVITDKQLPGNYRSFDKYATVKMIQYHANNSMFETNALSDVILVLTDNYYPGWNVTIDGKSSAIYRANYTFRAVPVPRGNHTITFSYQPNSFRAGVTLSLVSFLLLLLLSLKRFRIFTLL